jgi:hypothetical protein
MMRTLVVLALCSSVALADEDPLAPQALEGPFPSLEAAPDATNCKSEAVQKRPAEMPRGMVDLAVLECQSPEEEYFRRSKLALRTRAGWFISDSLATSERQGHSNYEVDETAVEKVPGLPVLAVSFHSSGYNRGERNSDGELNGDSQSGVELALCGVGSSAAPSCTPSFRVSYHRIYSPYPSERPRPELDVEWKIRVRYLRSAFVLSTSRRSRIDEKERKLLGRHPMIFP